MKFYELKRDQAFWFANETERSNYNLFKSAGVDGAYARYVSSDADYTDSNHWGYCSPMAEVVPHES